tara:strand:- start:534 stop:668 length:135 start_codon:yes stop_codon:yes gene_type:complete
MESLVQQAKMVLMETTVLTVQMEPMAKMVLLVILVLMETMVIQR